MTYPEQLQTTQWKNKRDEILKRDHFACQKCNNAKILDQAKKGKLNGNTFYVESENLYYVNLVLDPEFTEFDIKQTIFYGVLKNSTIFIIGARFKTPTEIEVENYKGKLEIAFKDKPTIVDDPEFSIKIGFINELEKKIKAEGFDNFFWLQFKGLHIHHKYYIKGYQAWEYNNEVLITLCEICHDEMHENQKIPVYNSKMEFLEFYKYCYRCNGKGVFSEYSHVQSGICFRCNGNRYEELITSAKPY